MSSLDCHRSKIVTVKYGGAAMSDDYSEEMVATDIAMLRRAGVHPVIVHGGGGCVTDIAARLGIETTFVNGHRVTDAAMMEAVVMGLAGKVNKEIVRLLTKEGVEAIGLCGIDGGLLRAAKLNAADPGMVGRVTGVNTALLHLLIERGMIPVIAPIGIDDDANLFNINADLAAGAVAAALGAEELIYLSNVPGIAVEGEILPCITLHEAHTLIEQGAIHGGMLPKLSSAFDALAAGVGSVRIVDGRAPGALMQALSGQGEGTEIRIMNDK